jgi:hypothetical protein
MTIDRRSGAPSTFTWLLGLALGATCAAMTPACSASSGAATPGGWGQSGGGPLGADQSSSGGGSGGGGSGGGDSDAGPTQPTGGNDAATGTPGDAGASGDATTGGDGEVVATDAATDSAGEGSVTGNDFTLIDTAITTVVDGSPVANFDPIPPGATINLAHVGTALSIRANTVPALVGSVAFALDATYTHTESTAPYTLCSDNGAGVVTSCASILTVGLHTLTATPYSAAALGGDAGAPFSLTFTIVDIDGGGGGDGGGDGGGGGIKDAGGQ